MLGFNYSVLLRRGEGRVMREVIEKEAEELLQRLAESIGNSNSYNYYQGRVDTLAWILRQLPEEG